MRRAVLFSLLSLAVLASGCAGVQKAGSNESERSTVHHDDLQKKDVQRIVYHQDGVVCYGWNAWEGYAQDQQFECVNIADKKIREEGR